MRELIPTVDNWFEAGEKVAVATVIQAWGSTPRPAGSQMTVSSSGGMAGSVSGGCVEGAVVEVSQDIIRSGLPQMLEFGVADELAWNVGLACGGSIRVWTQPLENDQLYHQLREAVLAGRAVVWASVVDGPDAGAKALLSDEGALIEGSETLATQAAPYVEEALSGGEPLVREVEHGSIFLQPYLPPKRLIVIGGVHTAIPLVTLAHTLDYKVTVVDARSAFATQERFPHADELLVRWPDEALRQLRPDRNTAVVVLTHDPKFDEPALSSALESDAGYIGAIGSRRTSADRLERLRALGFSSEQLERIHGPIGLDIGARTPAETALSIISEIVAESHQKQAMQLSIAGSGR